MIELYHAIGDPDSSAVRRVVTAAGIAPIVRMRNVHYDEVRADLKPGASPPAVRDGEVWHVGKDASIARLLQLPPRLESARTVLRPITSADVPALEAIAREPAVTRFWPQLDLSSYDATNFVIEHEGRAIGYAQYDENDDPEFRSAGVDVLLGARWQRQGFGREAVRRLCDYLFDARGHHRITIDPAAENAAAIACYEAVGFRRVGVLRQYQWLDGAWRDGVLLDLLASDR